MIHIEQNQTVPDYEKLRVFSVSGDYNDNDLIECYDLKDPSLVTGYLQAQFIKYGPIVYQYNTPEELGAELIKIDPESTHDAVALYKEEEERKKKRSAGTLEPENPVPAKDSSTLIEEESEQLVAPDATSTEQVIPQPQPDATLPETVPETTVKKKTRSSRKATSTANNLEAEIDNND